MRVFAPSPGRLRLPAYCRTVQLSCVSARRPIHREGRSTQHTARYQPPQLRSARCSRQQCRAQADERFVEAAPAPPRLEHRGGEDPAVFDPASQSATSWVVFTAVFAVVMAILYEVLPGVRNLQTPVRGILRYRATHDTAG